MDAVLSYLGKTDYEKVLELQRALNRSVNEGNMPDTIIFTEHYHVYTVGIHRNPDEIVDNSIRPIEVERGGSITYHGPGQVVVYFIVSLLRRKINVRDLIIMVQSAVVTLLGENGISAEGRLGKETGVWTSSGRKICSIGFAIKQSATLHGIALNVSTDLSRFSRIHPCGFDYGVMTSMEAESGKNFSVQEVQKRLKQLLLEELKIADYSETKNLESLERLF